MCRWSVVLLVVALSACKKDENKADKPDDKPVGEPKAKADPTPDDQPGEPEPDVPDEIEDLYPPCPGFTPFTAGTLKVEVTGAETMTFESTEVTSATGPMAVSKEIVLGYRTASGNERIAFEVPCTGTGTTKHNLGNFQTGNGVWIVGECTFDLKKHDATGLEGTFDCPALADMQSQDKTKTIKAVGTFAATR